MNYRITFSIQFIFLFTTAFSFGQDFLSLKISQKEAIEDFDYLKSAIEEGHSALYWFRDTTEVTHLFDSLRNEITEDISNANFHSLLKATLGTFSCGHTTLSFPTTYLNLIDSINKFIPLKIKLIEDKVFVVKDYSNQKIEAGSEILSINGIQIKTIVEKLKSKVPTDKNISSKQIRSLDFLFPYYLTLYYGIRNNFEVQYLSPRSENRMIKNITALPKNEDLIRSGREIYKSDSPIEFRLEQNQKIAYLTIKTFTPRNYKRVNISYADTLSKIFEEIKINNVENLILDLRSNLGGSMQYGETLFSFLIDQSTKYFRNAIIKKSVANGEYSYSKVPRLKERFESMYTLTEFKDSYILSNIDSVIPTSNHYNGELFILANGLSFSSTACFIALCKDKNRGVIIGENPGGAYSGLSTSPNVNITLPNTSYNLFFKATLINLAVKETEVDIKVDYKVSPTIEDVISKRDTEMLFTLKMISNK